MRCPAAALIAFLLHALLLAEDKPQYEFGHVKIAAATADEPRREQVSVKAASDYLDQGAIAWGATRGCVTCHTNGTYMAVRPALTPQLGPPSILVREFFETTLKKQKETDREALKKSTSPAQVIYVAAGLAEWDANVTKTLSPETADALALMFEIQQDDGTWFSLDCWPPYESDAYHEATVAAMAVATAPGWLEKLSDEKQKAGVERLKTYLKTTPPLHDYSRVLLLWASTRMPDLLTSQQKTELADLIFGHQRSDGGWSIRTFAAPEAWGRGNRAAKLVAEPQFADPESDGHQTGLAIVALRSAGVDAKDERIQKGVAWLLKNQRQSGRWWTRSLNTDTWHFITYSGTAYPLLALSMCDALPKSDAVRATGGR